jgi:hypothetical protein
LVEGLTKYPDTDSTPLPASETAAVMVTVPAELDTSTLLGEMDKAFSEGGVMSAAAETTVTLYGKLLLWSWELFRSRRFPTLSLETTLKVQSPASAPTGNVAVNV